MIYDIEMNMPCMYIIYIWCIYVLIPIIIYIYIYICTWKYEWHATNNPHEHIGCKSSFQRHWESTDSAMLNVEHEKEVISQTHLHSMKQQQFPVVSLQSLTNNSPTIPCFFLPLFSLVPTRSNQVKHVQQSCDIFFRSPEISDRRGPHAKRMNLLKRCRYGPMPPSPGAAMGVWAMADTPSEWNIWP